MAVEYSLLIQKEKEGSPVIDSLGAFGFAIGDIAWPNEEVEDVATRKWPGLSGEDVYLPPSGLKFKAYDLSVEFLYKGKIGTAYSQYKAFRNYLAGLDGTGAYLKVYDLYWGKGRKNVFLKKIDELTPYRTNIDEGVTFKATFRVADPLTEVEAVKNANGTIVNLTTV